MSPVALLNYEKVVHSFVEETSLHHDSGRVVERHSKILSQDGIVRKPVTQLYELIGNRVQGGVDGFDFIFRWFGGNLVPEHDAGVVEAESQRGDFRWDGCRGGLGFEIDKTVGLDDLGADEGAGGFADGLVKGGETELPGEIALEDDTGDGHGEGAQTWVCQRAETGEDGGDGLNEVVPGILENPRTEGVGALAMPEARRKRVFEDVLLRELIQQRHRLCGYSNGAEHRPAFRSGGGGQQRQAYCQGLGGRCEQGPKVVELRETISVRFFSK